MESFEFQNFDRAKRNMKSTLDQVYILYLKCSRRRRIEFVSCVSVSCVSVCVCVCAFQIYSLPNII